MFKAPPKIHFFLLQMIFSIGLNAQNLVPNPNFEDYSSCPTGLSQVPLLANWTQPSPGTSDFLHSCYTGPLGPGVPTSVFGYQEALSGQGYAGMYVHLGNVSGREYIQTQLTSPLVAGECYEVEMFTSPADVSWMGYAINHVGILLTATPPTIQPNGNIYASPQIYYEDIVNDTENWTQLLGTYTASGGEIYLTIGNFFEPGNYDLESLGNPGGFDVSYYFIENVRVEEAQGEEDIEASICPGECYEYDGIDYCNEGTFQINNPGGCFSQVNLTITLDELAVANISEPDTLNCTVESVNLDASGSSSGPGVSYQWTGPNNFNSNQQNPEVFDPGVYTLTVSGTGLCSTEVSVEVIENIIYPDISTELSGLIDCNNPIITLTGSSSIPNVSYQWSGPGVNTNSPIANTSQSGTYTFTVTTPGGCTSSEDVLVGEDLELPDIFAEVLGIIDCNNPTVLLSGSSITPNVTYVWSGPGLNTNNPVVSVDQPGSYTFVVIGPNGCVSSESVTVIEENTIPDINASSNGDLDCDDTVVTLIGSSNTPNVTYQWIGPGVFENGPEAETSQEGEYIFTVTNTNGCSAETSVFVVENVEAPEILIDSPNTITCLVENVDLDASSSNGQGVLSFEWQNSNGDVLGSTSILNVTAAGIYSLIITDDENGCTEITTVEVFEDTETPVSVINSTGALSCQDDLVTLDGSNSTGNSLSYQWADPNGEIISNSSFTDVAEEGVYTLLVTNTVNGCSATSSFEVVSNVELPTVTALTNDILDCDNTEATLDGNGSSEGLNYIYQWQNPVGDSISNTLQTVVGEAGVYTLIVFNTQNGCSSSATVEVEQDNETPIAVAGNDQLITCDESEVTLDGSGSSTSIGSLTFQWTNSNGDIISNSEITVVDLADVYTLTVFSENGCSASDAIEVTFDTNVPIADVGTGGTLDCTTSIITLGGNNTSSGIDIIYEWLDENNMIIATSSTTDVDLPGNYTLIVTNSSNNCSSSASIQIAQDIQLPVAEAGNDTTLNCQITEIILDGSQSSSGQNFNYQWLDSNGAPISDQLTTATDQPDTYTFIVTNTENSCSAMSFVIIDQNIEVPTADTGSDGVLDCNANEITLDGSNSSGNNLSFEWFNEGGSAIGNQAIVQVSEAGTFTLVVTNTESQCTAQSTVEVVPDDNLPTAIATPEGILTCESIEIIIDGSASTSVSGNINFEWQNEQGNVLSTTENISVNLPGNYTLIITDTDNGCSISTTVEIIQDTETPIANAGPNQILTCSQTNVTLDGSGSSGQNLNYEWQDESGNTIATTVTTTVASGGTYVLFVTNQTNGCSASQSVEIIPDTNLPTANAGSDETLNCTIDQIPLDGSASSSGMNIEYEWQNSLGDVIATTQTTIVNTPGTYTLIVLDTDNNCQTQDEVVISQDLEPPVPNIDYTSNQEIDCNNAAVILDATGSAPFGILSFEWSSQNGLILSGETTANPEMGQAGTYSLLVTNTENGCTAFESIEIVENLIPPTALINDPQPLTCITETIDLDATNSSTGNFIYSWISNPIGGIISGAASLQPTINQAGVYQLTVFNNENGCQTTAQITVMEDITPPIAVANTEEEFDCITESITLSGTGSSIGSEFNYQWTGNSLIDNANTLNPTIYQAGNYNLLVTNTENGCTQTTSVLINENENMPTAMETISNDPLCFGQTGNLSIVSITGGEQPYLYSIDGGANFTPLNSFSSLQPGQYNILIQDMNGCELEEVIVIEAVDPITVQLQGEVELELGENYQIEAISNIDTSEIAQIIWSPSENLSCTNCLNPTIEQVLNETQYSLTIINENGCQATAQIMLRVDKTKEVYIPNAFSPGNADGQNDRFIIYAKIDKVKQVNTFRVFDRWGEQVFLAENFQPNDPTFGWDGTLGKEKLNPAVFVYLAEIEFIDGVKMIYKGDVTILE